MPLLVWKDNLSVRIKSMDEQHKKLIDMINDFYDNIAHQPNKDNIANLLSKLKNYIEVHFSLEEKYMKQVDYPEFKNHKKEHDLFVTKVNEVEEKLNSGKLVLSLEMTVFLKNWLVKHIQGTDKKYSDFFIQKGIL